MNQKASTKMSTVLGLVFVGIFVYFLLFLKDANVNYTDTMETVYGFSLIFGIFLVPVLLELLIAFIFTKITNQVLRFSSIIIASLSSFPFFIFLAIDWFSDGGTDLRFLFSPAVTTGMIFWKSFIIWRMNKSQMAFQKALTISFFIDIPFILLAILRLAGFGL